MSAINSFRCFSDSTLSPAAGGLNVFRLSDPELGLLCWLVDLGRLSCLMPPVLGKQSGFFKAVGEKGFVRLFGLRALPRKLTPPCDRLLFGSVMTLKDWLFLVMFKSLLSGLWS